VHGENPARLVGRFQIKALKHAGDTFKPAD
jgi:hypothetical protein